MTPDQAAHMKATGELLANLLRTRPEYVSRWSRDARRTRGQLNQRGIAAVLANYVATRELADASDRTRGPRSFKNQVSRALTGTYITHHILRLFIDAFEMTMEDEHHLWRTFTGESYAPAEIESVDPKTGSIIAQQVISQASVAPLDSRFRTEESHVTGYVNAAGEMYRTVRNRRVRVLTPDAKYYRFKTIEGPESLRISRVRFEIEPPLSLARVFHLGPNNYVWDLALPPALKVGDIIEINAKKTVDAAGAFESFLMVRNRRGAAPRLYVFFEGAQPARVWWFERIMSRVAPGQFNESQRLTRLPDGSYGRDFDGARDNDTVGIAWQWLSDL